MNGKVTMEVIAAACGLPPQPVWLAISGKPGVGAARRTLILSKAKELGYAYKPKSSPREEVERLAMTGATPLAIIRATGVERTTVYRVRRRLGLNGNRPEPNWPQHVQRIRHMKQSGMSYADIASEYDVSRQRIQQLIRVARGKKCAKCGTSKRLHGHHLNYITDESKTLCVRCHRREH